MNDAWPRLLRHLLPLFLAAIPPATAGAGTDVQINTNAPGTVENEPRLTQNPTDPQNFIVAHNNDAGAAFSPLSVSFSLDGGSTWMDVLLGIPTHPILGTIADDGNLQPTIFDPFIDSDSLGNIYAGYIATDGTGSGPPSGIFIESSTDKGNTWSGPIQIDFDVRQGEFGNPASAYRFNDRPDMAIDPGTDDVHVVWIKDVGVGMPTSDIYHAASPPTPPGIDFSGISPGSVASHTVNDMPNGTDRANVPDFFTISPKASFFSGSFTKQSYWLRSSTELFIMSDSKCRHWHVTALIHDIIFDSRSRLFWLETAIFVPAISLDILRKCLYIHGVLLDPSPKWLILRYLSKENGCRLLSIR